MKTRFSQRGASLIETMIAVGLLGMVAYFVTTMIKNGTVGQKTLQSQDDARTMTDNMATVLSDPLACQNTFALPTAVAPAGGPTVNVIKDSQGNPAYTVGNKYSTKSLQLKSIQIGGSGKDGKSGIERWSPVGSPATSGTAFVLVTWTQTGVANGSATGATDLTRFFLVNATSLNATGGILNCQAQASGGGGGGFWTLNATTGNIYNNNSNGAGSVGIGIALPIGIFDVYSPMGHSLLVLPNGNVGIGTATPVAPLNVASVNAWQAWNQADFRIGNNTDHLNIGLATGGGGEGDVRIYAAGATMNRIMFGTGTSQNDALTIYGSNVGIGTTSPTVPLEVNGDVKAASFISTSDARLKTQIRSLSDGLEKILQLRGVAFSWLKDGSAGMGVIAQEVEKVFPEIVVTDKVSGFKAVRYDSLIAPLIEAVKSLYGMCRDLMVRTDDNSRRLAALEASNAAKDAVIRNLERRIGEQEREMAMFKTKLQAP